ncbi:MAG: hemerythrin domain-containing protein, partial [Candidatus Xenobia bacterium]
LLQALSCELRPHLNKEERVLFPAMRAGEGWVQAPIQVMMSEHDHAGDLLLALRTTTAQYTPPESACASYRALYAGLSELEQDLHRHIHLENNVLFPRAIA